MRIIRAILIAATLAVPSVVHAETAYYDLAKVVSDCAECKSDAKAINADAKTHQAEINKLLDEAKAADASCAKRNVFATSCSDATAKRQRVQQLHGRYQAQVDKAQTDSATKAQARVLQILPALAKARHLSAILPEAGAFYAAPSADVTAEIIRRLDAGDDKDVDRIRAENVKLRAELAAAKAAPKK